MYEGILHKELSQKLIGAAFEVHNVLGYGFLEKVYENSLAVELKLQGVFCEQQKNMTVYYKANNVGDYFADLFVDNKIIVELKAEKVYNKKHEAQLLNYLKALKHNLGYLINFGEEKVEFKRFIYSA